MTTRLGPLRRRHTGEPGHPGRFAEHRSPEAELRQRLAEETPEVPSVRPPGDAPDAHPEARLRALIAEQNAHDYAKLPVVAGTDLPQLGWSGPTTFDPTLVKQARNQGWNKPSGGLWLSPASGAATVWGDVSEGDGAAHGPAQPVALRDDARVLRLGSRRDFEIALAAHGTVGRHGDRVLDFEHLATQADAVWLSGEGVEVLARPSRNLDLYGWDIETVLVLDPKALSSR